MDWEIVIDEKAGYPFASMFNAVKKGECDKLPG